MSATDLLASWATWSPLERSVVRDVYFRQRSFDDVAAHNRVHVDDVLRALHSAYRRVATQVLEPDVEAPRVQRGRVADTLRSLAQLRSATWWWNTADEQMTWSEELYDLYGYPPGAVSATIGLHQAHKQDEDRAVAEGLVLRGATERGAVVFPQRIVRTDGTLCHVVMRVTRQPGPGEVLVGHVVTNQTNAD